MPARIPQEELESLRRLWLPVHIVEGHDPEPMHQQLADTLDTVIDEIRAIQSRAREEGDFTRPVWPAIVMDAQGLDRPQGGGWGAGGRDLARPPGPDHRCTRTKPDHLAQLEAMSSDKAEELFDSNGRSA